MNLKVKSNLRITIFDLRFKRERYAGNHKKEN